MAPIDFFISYTRADRTWAEWIAWQLEETNHTVELQAWDYRPGGNFVLSMDESTKNAERTIVVLSPDYFTSKYTPAEWAVAFRDDPQGKERKILPVQVRDCGDELKGLLSPIGYIDLVGLDEPTAKKKLLDGLQRTRVKPATAPQFPGSTHQEKKL